MGVTKQSQLTFAQYQDGVEETDEKKRTLTSLLGLVGEIGDLHSLYKKGILAKDLPQFKEALAEELGDILWYIASLASRHRLSLEELAISNLNKARQLFDSGEANQWLDKDYPEDERFPRQFAVEFEEKKVDTATLVKIKINGVYVGDGLDDNAHDDDGYRYHDVFHLAYAACLGWSPVIRGLLRRKRKSNPDIDRVEDGARATFLEEAISVFVFNQAAERDHYREFNSIDIGLLKTIKKLTSNLEVKACTAKQWQKAIYHGYSMFHQLKENRGGIISLDLDRRSISYAPLASKMKKSTRGEKNAGRTRNDLSGSVEKRSDRTARKTAKHV